MKRKIALWLWALAVISIGSVVGCGGSDDEAGDEGDQAEDFSITLQGATE